MTSSRSFIILAFVAWLSASVAGMVTIWNYEGKPGMAASAPVHWPNESTLVRHDSQSILLVWLHPRCPCSRATVGELERLLVRLPEDVACQVVMTQPKESDADFVETSLTETVRQLPRVSVHIDEGQHEAKRFGVSTSGQVLLYDRNADLVYAGGITAGRGHQGDNLGASTLREIFRGADAKSCQSQCSVYGCDLLGLDNDRGPSP